MADGNTLLGGVIVETLLLTLDAIADNFVAFFFIFLVFAPVNPPGTPVPVVIFILVGRIELFI